MDRTGIAGVPPFRKGAERQRGDSRFSRKRKVADAGGDLPIRLKLAAVDAAEDM